MNNTATISKMNQMKLSGMARLFDEILESTTGLDDFSLEELVGHLVDAEWESRQNRKIQRLLKAARFRYNTSFEQIY